MTSNVKTLTSYLALPLLGVLALAACVAVLASPQAEAQSMPAGKSICRTSIIIDRSGSVGPAGLQTMGEQIKRLFQPTGIYDERVQLGFWTFSHALGNQANSNYNVPFYGHVSSKGQSSAFDTAFASIRSGGNTNYEQGFAYNNSVRNPAMNDMINASDVLVFMTDGMPNSSNGGWSQSALEAGRAAAQRHLDQGRIILGGNIGRDASQRRNINYTITGNSDDRSKTFDINGNYSDLAAELKRQISRICYSILVPEEEECPFNPSIPISSPECPGPCWHDPTIPSTSPNCYPPCEYNTDIPSNDPRCVRPPYSLAPNAAADSGVISSNDSATISYKVTNSSATMPSLETNWTISRVVVDRGQDWQPLRFDGQPYRDNYSCARLLQLIGNKGDCQANIASGKKQFPAGETVLTEAELGGANTLVMDDRWQVGTKLCYVLSVDRPTEKDSPINRFSSAACVTVGKRPTAQVHGGDLIVNPVAGASEAAAGGVTSSLTIKGGAVNRTFGSWAEYGVMAPGDVTGFASASGLAGGYPSVAPATQNMWSKLTFANVAGEYGRFSAGVAGTTQSSRTVSALLYGRTVTTNLDANDSLRLSGGTVKSGLYRKTNGNLRLDAGSLDKQKTVIVHVPNGTVTIAGEQRYHEGPYASLSELPQLIIIARNIVVTQEVGQVDAWLIAQGTNATEDGVISTCDVNTSLSSEVCGRSLKVNGPVMARQLQLKRTAGAGTGAASDEAAEVFNLRADTYLWAHSEGRSEQRADVTYTTELAPHF